MATVAVSTEWRNDQNYTTNEISFDLPYKQVIRVRGQCVAKEGFLWRSCSDVELYQGSKRLRRWGACGGNKTVVIDEPMELARGTYRIVANDDGGVASAWARVEYASDAPDEFVAPVPGDEDQDIGTLPPGTPTDPAEVISFIPSQYGWLLWVGGGLLVLLLILTLLDS